MPMEGGRVEGVVCFMKRRGSDVSGEGERTSSSSGCCGKPAADVEQPYSL